MNKMRLVVYYMCIVLEGATSLKIVSREHGK